MLFNSIHFMLFFPVVLLVLFVIPKKLRCFWLLAASYYFYMSWNPKYALLIAFSTLTTYLSGIILDKVSAEDTPNRDKKRKLTVAFSFIINIGILFFFKYFDFLLDNINAVLNTAGISLIENPFDIILPVGISFYTFQALSYTMDIYRGEVKVEKNIIRYALFVSFFPQLVAGPIERSSNLIAQIEEIPTKKLWNYERVIKGLIMVLWGLFMKMVIADRVASLANKVFNNYWTMDSFALIIGALGFALQIYCDFASYSTIAIGAAQIMDIKLMENFDTPYFAQSIKEFWRRWHISLSTWFRDYLYIPLGGNRCSRTRKCINLMITFLVSGLWHGAAWNYVVWGGLHGAYQIIGELTLPFRKRLKKYLDIDDNSISGRLGKTLVTFGLTTFAWIFFRSKSLSAAFVYIQRIFTRIDLWSPFSDAIYELGLDNMEMNVLFVAVVILLLVDLIKYLKNKRLDDFLFEQNLWFRWAVLIALFMGIVIFGAYGSSFDPQAFIYFQF